MEVLQSEAPVRMTEKKKLNPLAIIGSLFFIFGFVTWLSSVLKPYLQIACELNNFQSYLVAFAFYVSYFIMGVPSGWILKRTGFKKGLSLGLLLVAVGSLLFIPAAVSRLYTVFLMGLFVQGAGLTILQTASNPYVTILGPKESAARRISMMGICNGIAGAIAPVVLGSVILRDADALTRTVSQLNPLQKAGELDRLAGKVIAPYLVITLVLVILAVAVYFSSLPEVNEEQTAEDEGVEVQPDKTSIFQFPHLLIGVGVLFLYTGVEVIAGNSIIGYGAYQGIALSTAKFFTSFTLVCMLAGYLVGIVCIPKYLRQETALTWSALLGVLFAVLALTTSGLISVVFVALLGLANSLMWPSIWPLAISGLGRLTKMGSSLLVMAISGAAVLPLLYGYLADRTNPQLAYGMVIPCYLAIGYYAVAGHKTGRKTVKKQHPTV